MLTPILLKSDLSLTPLYYKYIAA